MIGIADAVVALAIAPFVLCAIYLGALALLALIVRRRVAPTRYAPLAFTVVVPAHNEAGTLPALLTSLGALNYPRDLWRVYVIADNCGDETASVARAHGAEVYERHDPARRSKGHAIEWLLAQDSFRARQGDAIVFVDADCVVSPNMLRAFSARLADGADVLQAYYDIRDADASPTLQLRQIALGLVHLLRPLGKSVYGGSAGLKGTGMCFRREVLDIVGWNAHGLAEDVEQHLRLVRSGYKVRFVPEARVSGFMAHSLADSGEQHRRWEAGRLHALRTVPALLGAGLRSRSITMLDAAAEQLVPPLSIIVGVLAAGAAAAMLFDLPWALGLSLRGLALLMAYVVAGVVLQRPHPVSLIRAVAVAPWYISWKLATYARALITSRSAAWVRTTRDGAAPP